MRKSFQGANERTQLTSVAEQAVNELNIALAAVGSLLLVLGLFTSLINHIGFLSEPLLALLAGVMIGPVVFDLLDLTSLGNQETILQQAALLTLGVALMGTALRLPASYISRNLEFPR